MSKLLSYFPPFINALREQLHADDIRYGNTWIKRGREEQEDRIMERITEYWDNYAYDNEPMPWLKIAGLAFIGWVRESFDDWGNDG